MPLLPPDLAAYFATIGEHAFSVLLLIGLASRLSALGLFGMTMVIQLFVFPDGWPEHILWISLKRCPWPYSFTRRRGRSRPSRWFTSSRLRC